VKAFLDTSVLVATFYGDHEHHGPSIRLFSELKKQTGSTAAYCLAEAYAVMTGMPGKNRASPNEALLFIRDAFERLTIVTLDTDEYLTTLESAVAESIAGGTVYDAIIGQCALNANAQTIYTWSKKHFMGLGEAIAGRVRAP
jgi:predicted nucleic acid-binding protein